MTKPGARGVGGEVGGHRGHSCPRCQGSPRVLRMELAAKANGAELSSQRKALLARGDFSRTPSLSLCSVNLRPRAWNSWGAEFKVLAPGIEPRGSLGPKAGSCAQIRAGERAWILGFCAPSARAGSSAGLPHACTYMQRDSLGSSVRSR